MMKPNENNLNPTHARPDAPDDIDDQPLRLVPDDPEEERFEWRLGKRPSNSEAARMNDTTKTEPSPSASASSAGEPLQWALDSLHEPAMASADWLARDIDSKHSTAAQLLGDPSITLEQVRQAKAAFKTMRIVGEKSADRRVGARMYAAAIAVALVRFKKRISTQSDEALKRGFKGLLDDRRMPQSLRDLAGQALCVLAEMDNRDVLPEQSNSRSKTA